MKISFYTFGCTINSYETQKLKDIFSKQGDEIVEETDSDAVIINSCAITGAAEKNVQRLITRLKRKNSQRIIAVVGCYGEMLHKNGKTKYPDVDILMGNDKFEIFEKIHAYDIHHEGSSNSPVKAIAESGFMQVQNGCDNHCSYCIVPHLRGNSVSKDPIEIREELLDMANSGYKEIVLAGLNLGLYQRDGYDLLDILKMADEIDGIERIRLSSLEPMDVNSRFLEEFPTIKKLVSHLHISLQSGCDNTLKQMNRNYRFEDYLSMITKIREKVPGIAISTDIIVGFPGETENDFQESMLNAARCQFSDIHIFKYSVRKGTPAASMPNQITEHQKTSRAGMLKGIKLQTRYNYLSGFLGKTVNASLFKKTGDSSWEGMTENNIRVFVQGPDMPADGKSQVKITGVIEDSLQGNI